MPKASCHCGAVEFQVPRKPRYLTDCNCSICRRYGILWAYYRHKGFRILHGRRRLVAYMWGKKMLKFFHCDTCGCVTHAHGVRSEPGSMMGVNARLMEPKIITGTRIRRFDGANTWKYLD